jgi:hypothetical protein
MEKVRRKDDQARGRSKRRWICLSEMPLIFLSVFATIFPEWKLETGNGGNMNDGRRAKIINFRTAVYLFITLVAGLSLPLRLQAAAGPTADEIYRSGIQAYIYGYPLVLMDLTRQRALQRGAINRFSHAPAFPSASFRNVVRPNCDTLYSSAWLDLSGGPMIVSLPETGGRYYLLQILDAWTETLAVPGKRTTGTKPLQVAIVGPDWKGSLPPDLMTVKSTTNMVFLIGRIQTNTPTDYAHVHEIQKGFKLSSLNPPLFSPARPENGPPSADRQSSLPPPKQVAAMEAVTFFKTLAFLLRDNHPHPEDVPIMPSLKTLGLTHGRTFNLNRLGPEALRALERAVQEARIQILQQGQTLGTVQNGWRFNRVIGKYGTAYLKRAAVALGGLGALPAEEAVYGGTSKDNEGNPLTGAGRYIIHFTKAGLPPVNAFWSLTLYDREGYFVANPLERFALGDRDPLRYNSDGSLDLYIQSDRPSLDREANWLPAPGNFFTLSLRLYWPKPEVSEGRWSPPVVRRVE